MPFSGSTKVLLLSLLPLIKVDSLEAWSKTLRLHKFRTIDPSLLEQQLAYDTAHNDPVLEYCLTWLDP